jgi:pimeloyl-ACP methyl ester carboxylesterase
LSAAAGKKKVLITGARRPSGRSPFRGQDATGFAYLTIVGSYGHSQAEPQGPAASTRLTQVRVPTLVIVGDQDVSGIKANDERLAAEIHGARKVIISNTAHVPNMERPKEFNQIVLEFLASLGW